MSQHAKEQCIYRGTNEKEIYESILNSSWEKVEIGRIECKKDFIFDSIWNKKNYHTKQVKPIFIEEVNEIVVITVYVYYF